MFRHKVLVQLIDRRKSCSKASGVDGDSYEEMKAGIKKQSPLKNTIKSPLVNVYLFARDLSGMFLFMGEDGISECYLPILERGIGYTLL